MNIADYVKKGGKCKSKSGHWFILDCVKYEEYPIKGWLLVNNGTHYLPCRWTEDGVPHNLPYTHGLDLIPVVPVTTYKMVDKKILSNCDTMSEFEYATQDI